MTNFSALMTEFRSFSARKTTALSSNQDKYSKTFPEAQQIVGKSAD